MLKLASVLFGVLASYQVYQTLNTLDYFNNTELQSTEKCFTIKTPKGPEDIQVIGRLAISGFDDRLSLYEDDSKGPLLTPNGGIIAIDPLNQSYYELNLENFPNGKQFHPLGLHIYNNKTLYVINYDYKSGGDKVEVFSIHEKGDKLGLKHQVTVNFRENWMGQLNDLWVVGEKEFYATVWQPFPDPTTGRDHSLLTTLKRFAYFLFWKNTPLLHCKIAEEEAFCEAVDYGFMFNGITSDGKVLYVVDTLAGHISRYQLKEGLHRLDPIFTGFKNDNIEYDPKSKSLFASAIRLKDYLWFLSDFKQGKFSVLPGGVVEVKPSLEVRKVIFQGTHSGTSIGVPFENWVLMGSWHHDQVMVCPFESN